MRAQTMINDALNQATLQSTGPVCMRPGMGTQAISPSVRLSHGVSLSKATDPDPQALRPTQADPWAITPEQVMDARDWASDCLGLAGGVKVSADRAMAYVQREYPGGWDAFAAEASPRNA